MRVPDSVFQAQGLSATAKAIWLASLWVEHELTPAALLSARRVGAQAKLLYKLLQLVPGFGRREFSITYKALGRFAQIRHGTRKAALDELARAGWLRMRLTRVRADNVAHFV